MRKRLTIVGILLVTIQLVTALCGCDRSIQSDTGSASQTAAAQNTATMGTDFNGNKTPAYAYFGDRTYEQRQYDASTLRDEYVTNTSTGSYTVMIYLDGSTNLEDPNFDYNGSIFGSMTIDAILSSGVDPDCANVVIMTGGSDSWGHAGLEGNGNYILHVVKDGDKDDLSARIDYHSEKPLNMGDPSTLCFFIDFAEKQYPADHYALIVWDHGDGPVYGCAVDENYNADSLSLLELSEALDATDFGKSKMLDWVGFDCCLMGDLEVADALSKYSYYMIGSQETETGFPDSFEYGTAWVYSFLEELNSSSSPIAIATEAIDQYANGKELASSNRNERHTYTMSLLDLTKVENVEKALDGLFYTMANDLDAGEFAELAKLREYTKEFSEGEGYDIVDLGYMVWTLEEKYPEESRSVKEAIDELVLYQRTNIPEASGISLYYPYRNEELYDELGGRDLYAQTDISKSYSTYLEKFTDILANGEADSDWEIDGPKPENREDSTRTTDIANGGELMWLAKTGHGIDARR